MTKSYRFLVSVLFLGAYLLSACIGGIPQQDDSPGSSNSSQMTGAVFTGTIESMEGTQWLISGQLVNVDDASLVDPNIQVGDIVKVEASVSTDGAVVALKIESSGPDDAGANDNSANGNDSNTDDSNTNASNANTNTNDNTNSANDNSNSNGNSNDAMGVGQESYGTVEAVTSDSITIGGVTYKIADFTEFRDIIAVGDQVKIHVIVNGDGTLTIREIEKSSGTSIGNDNSNSNDNHSNLNGNDDSHDDNNTNNNSNDDEHDDDNKNSNSNDD